jgi:uncharacterized protein YecE (DUF72 family)
MANIEQAMSNVEVTFCRLPSAISLEKSSSIWVYFAAKSVILMLTCVKQYSWENYMSTAEISKIPLDKDLMQALQKNAEAQKLGIAEFVRRAVHFYLRLNEEQEIRRQYQKGYGEADLTELALEVKDWEEEQAWPEP